jgi:hypothetical protein
MRFIERNEIDTERWNERVARDSVENIFIYAWYLDAVSENWGALVTENYQTILPIPYTIRLGIKQVYQPLFTRELDLLGEEFSWAEAMTYLKQHFRTIHFRNSINNLFQQPEIRYHQYLSFTGDYQEKFSTNAKRQIKKSIKHYNYQISEDQSVLLALFTENVAHKIENMGKEEFTRLHHLFDALSREKKGLLFVGKNEEDQTVVAGYFMFDKNRVTYLKGAADESTKKFGAMYGLMAHAMDYFAEEYTVFDFGGSEIKGVAEFFHKFGALDRDYYSYTFNQAPFWFNLLKRWKR